MHGCRPRQQLQSHLYICHRRKLCNDARGTFQKLRQQSGQVRFTILQSKNPLVGFSSACRIDIESIDLRKGINNLGGISIYDRYIVVASQEDDRLELYTFDEEKEEIKPTGNTLDIIQPVCVAL